MTTTDTFETLKSRVSRSLVGFTDDFPDDQSRYDIPSSKPDSREFPVPELVLFMMRNVMEWQWSGTGEKVRWTVYGSFKGFPVFFEHRKFGFAIGMKGGDAKDRQRLINQLKNALRHVETFLAPIAKHQVSLGQASIANRYSEFESRYRFFRENADKAYAKASRKPRKSRPKPSGENEGKSDKDLVTDFVSDMTAGMNRMFMANQEGFYYSTAMVDAYFSLLEHRLVLLRAFTGKPLAEGELLEFLGGKWDVKLNQIVSDAALSGAHLGKMRDIKERIRNPFAHGGFENDGGSIFFHMPNVGAIPTNFSRFGNSVRFSFIPIEQADHAELCAIFDGLDELLTTGALERPHRLMDAGVDPAYDQFYIKKIHAAVAGSDEDMEDFLERWSREWMMHANMDY
ncbi:hypothetical protein [Rhizobium sp.]|uniref:hypothetical protein n=1 Tax=Rhizobium sp. TaxID=391 RepID=UPI0028B1C1EA